MRQVLSGLVPCIPPSDYVQPRGILGIDSACRSVSDRQYVAVWVFMQNGILHLAITSSNFICCIVACHDKQFALADC